MSHPDPIPISLVAHYIFCPRRAWLESVGEHSDAVQIQIGTSVHARVDDPKTAVMETLRAVDVYHDEWGLTGRLDVLSGKGGKSTIREFKATPIRAKVEVTPAMRTQLALQAACLEYMGVGPSDTEIYFSSHNRTVAVELDEQDYCDAKIAVEKTRAIVNSETAPEPLEDEPRCMRCSHAGVCLPDERRLTSGSRRIIVSVPDAQVVYLTTPGSRAHLRAGKILVESKGERLAEIPLELVQGMQVHGNIDLSSGLVRELLWRNIGITWCTGSGRMVGWAQSTYGPNGLQRVRQHVASSEGRLALSREFIASKIANQATRLRRANVGEPVVDLMRRLQRRVSTAETWQTIIGLEGEAAAVYFENWPLLIKERERAKWDWNGRSGRPATDPVNAMLNYGYSMLTSEAVKAIVSCGLDPHAGFLHSSNRNKPALALDLIEEFRAPIVDSIVQTIINNGEVKPEQFSNTLGTWTMNDAARKSLVSAYSRRLETEIRHPIFGYSATWRRVIEIQARQVLGYLDGSQRDYRGVRVR